MRNVAFSFPDDLSTSYVDGVSRNFFTVLLSGMRRENSWIHEVRRKFVVAIYFAVSPEPLSREAKGRRCYVSRAAPRIHGILTFILRQIRIHRIRL